MKHTIRRRGSFASFYNDPDERDDSWDEEKEKALHELRRTQKLETPGRNALRRFARKHEDDLDPSILARTLGYGDPDTDEHKRLARLSYLLAKNSRHAQQRSKAAQISKDTQMHQRPSVDPEAALRVQRRRGYIYPGRRLSKPVEPTNNSVENEEQASSESYDLSDVFSPIGTPAGPSSTKNQKRGTGRRRTKKNSPWVASDAVFQAELEKLQREAAAEQARMAIAMSQEETSRTESRYESMREARAASMRQSRNSVARQSTSAASRRSTQALPVAKAIKTETSTTIESNGPETRENRPTKVQRPQNGHKIPSGSSKPSDEVKGTGEIRLRSLEVVHRMHDDEREKRELAHKQALQYAQERHAKVEHAFQRAQKLKSKLREAIKSIDESDQGSILANGDAKCTSNNESARSRVLQIDRGLPDAAAIGSSTMVSPMLAKTLRHIEDTLWTPLF